MATTLSFSKVGEAWTATTDSIGTALVQIKRNAKSKIIIEYYIDGMDPITYDTILKAEANTIFRLNIPVGLKVKITSLTEVVKGMMIAAQMQKSEGGGTIPDNILVVSDIVNTLDSDATEKVLSAAQGKALKTLIPVAATTSKAGIVKKAAAVTKPADDTNANLKTAIDQMITNFTNAGLM